MSTLVTQQAYLLLGTNLGDREQLLHQALASIAQEIGLILQRSSIYETAAWGNENQPHYLNQVVSVATPLTPVQLLHAVNGIERKMGRQRVSKWESRLIDIDILFYADQLIDLPNLQIPHPQLPNRRFALVPLQEIAPFLIHPALNLSVSNLLARTSDHLTVQRYQTNTTYEQHEI